MMAGVYKIQTMMSVEMEQAVTVAQGVGYFSEVL